MKGRKPLPTETKRASGTLQPCRMLKNEMKGQPVDDMPAPPEYLDEVGVKEWNDIIPQLKASRVLSKTDLSIVAMYCNEVSTYIECQLKMREQNSRVMVIMGDNKKIKYAQQVPYQKIANEALERALKIATEFGFTPAARTRIGVQKPFEQKSIVMELMQGAKKTG